MDEVCGICGVSGYPEKIALCHGCNQVSEHIYCMRTHLEEVPDIWFCEACQVSESDSHCPTTSNHMDQKLDRQVRKQKSIYISELMGQGLFIPDKRKKGSPEACSPLYKRKKSFKAPEAGKVKFITEAEAAHLRSGSDAMLLCQSPLASGSLMPRKGSASILPIKNVVWRTAKRSFPSRSEKTTCSGLQEKEDVDSKRINNATVWGVDQIDKQKHACVQASGKKTSQNGNYGSSNEAPTVATNKMMEKPIGDLVDASTSLGPIVAHPTGDRESEKDSSSSNHLTKNLDDCRHSPRSIVPKNWDRNITWKGSFEVHGMFFEGNIYHGIEAYRSNSIGHKACEALERMPRKLVAVLLPRSKVWPRSFQKQFPDADDVALYFLPSDFESSKVRYIDFLKRIDTCDLAIRCHFQGAGLLVFPSKHLSVDSQGQTLEPYLWGVLCRPSAAVPASRNGNLRLQFSQQVELCNKSNNACEVKLEEEGIKDIGRRANDGVIGVDMRRPTSVESVVKTNILTAANVRDKMRLGGSGGDHQQTQIKQEEHPNVPLARNSKMQEVQNNSILPPISTKTNAVVSVDRGFPERPPGLLGPPGLLVPPYDLSATGLTSPGSKKELSFASNDGISKRIFEGSVQKSSMWQSASSKFLNVPPSFSKSSSSPVAKDSQAHHTVANAVRSEPKLQKCKGTDYRNLLPHSEMKPTSCGPFFCPVQRDNLLSGNATCDICGVHGCKIGGEYGTKQRDSGTQTPIAVSKQLQVHDSNLPLPFCRTPPVVAPVNPFVASEHNRCNTCHESIAESSNEEKSHLTEEAGAAQERMELADAARTHLQSSDSTEFTSENNLKNESLCLSLSRPQYWLNGNIWITALSKESLEDDGCGNAEKLQLRL